MSVDQRVPRPRSVASAARLAGVRPTSSSSEATPERATARATAVPTDPVAPTRAMAGAWGSPLAIWATDRAVAEAVKELPFVMPTSVRRRSRAPPAVAGAVSAPSPTMSAPRAIA